jgi:nucleotide-binding universal stress UspA family protein
MKKLKSLLTFPPKKILVPLDRTDASRVAWRYAKDLGAAFGAQVDGLYIKEWLFYGQAAPMMADVAPELAALRESLGAGSEIRAVSGSIEGTILAWGRELDYDLVVMGTHGRTGFDHFLRGSIAEAVMRYAEIPVLVTRRDKGLWRSVLAPVNFEPYAMKGLAAAGEVAAYLGARLRALYVVDTPLYGEVGGLRSPRRMIDLAVEALPQSVRETCRPKALLAFGSPIEEIGEAAKDADLVVLAGHHKGTLSELMLGETTQRLLRHCETPLLVLPSRAAAKRVRAKKPALAAGIK